MKSKLRILHLEGDSSEVELVHAILEDGGIESDSAKVQTPIDFIRSIEKREFDIILADYSLPSFDGISALKLAQEKCPEIPFVFWSGLPAEEQEDDQVTPSVLRALRQAQKSVELHDAEQALREGADNGRSELQLKDAESKFRSLVERVPAIVYMAEFGPSGKWLYISPQVEKILGFKPEEVQGNPGLWFKQVHPDDRQKVLDLEERSQQSGEPIILEYRMYSKDGRLVWFRDEGNTIPPGNNRAAYMQGVMLDITDLKRAEEMKGKLEQQLRQAQKIEAIGQLAGGVAHDFNNLLMAISGYCELLLMKVAENDPVRKDVTEISKAAEQGASLTRQLLAFSRKQILQPKTIDINEVLSNLDGILKRLIPADIELCTVPTNKVGLVTADPGQIEQVIMNLILNARDAMPDGGKLTIETGNVVLDEEYSKHHVSVNPGRYVVLAVSDSGSGMDEETKLRIFEPFFTTKPEGKGTGLGLSTVYGIVKQSGGYIWVYSELGKGTTFKIYLPRVDQETSFVEEKPAVAAAGSETILLVDDNDSVRNAVAYLLEVRGYTVIQAQNGETALQLASEYSNAIDLMITDMVMPHMSGMQLAKELETSRPDMKVLYMSGYTEEAVNRHGILHPSLNFLQKPTSMDVLLHKIREILGEPGQEPKMQG